MQRQRIAAGVFVFTTRLINGFDRRDDLHESPSQGKQNGTRVTRPSNMDWRREVAMRLIKRQRADGSWQNDNGHRWEKDPNLVTAYAVMSLEIIYRGM